MVEPNIKASINRRATVHDVAAKAGVSLATVDRVLNARPGVRAKTIAQVESAIAEIGFIRDLSASLLARGRPLAMTLIAPDADEPLWKRLFVMAQKEQQNASATRMALRILPFRSFDMAAAAQCLDGLHAGTTDIVLLVARGGERLRQSVDEAVARGLKVITLIEDTPASLRHAFCGIDDRAAGQVAADLLGRFVPAHAKVGIILGFRDRVDQQARFDGFCAAMRRFYPNLILLGPEEGFDEAGLTGASVSSLVADHPDIAGLYLGGAGLEGLVDALTMIGRIGQIRVVAHDLSAVAEQALEMGAIDAIIDRDVEVILKTAIRHARDLLAGHGARSDPPLARINILMRHNLPRNKSLGLPPDEKPA